MTNITDLWDAIRVALTLASELDRPEDPLFLAMLKRLNDAEDYTWQMVTNDRERS